MGYTFLYIYIAVSLAISTIILDSTSFEMTSKMNSRLRFGCDVFNSQFYIHEI